MNISELWPSQYELRHPVSLSGLISLLEKKGNFSIKNLSNNYTSSFHQPRIIKINIFEDGFKIVHDGHHRVIAILLSGRDFLYSDEYEIVHHTYEGYMSVNFNIDWVTPFDPRFEVRFGNYTEYKKKVQEIRETLSDKKAIEYIYRMRPVYIRSRLPNFNFSALSKLYISAVGYNHLID
ncbi:MAG: hypothetical protein HC836_44900 [Richelia sp. RM2_1_2]|nr:hypothetical protein [Richelia sp. RM2_1_2]